MIWQKFENPWLDTTALRLNVELDHTIRAHKTEDMTTCTGRSAHSKYFVIRQLLPCEELLRQLGKTSPYGCQYVLDELQCPP